jgi:hypothetical protein
MSFLLEETTHSESPSLSFEKLTVRFGFAGGLHWVETKNRKKSNDDVIATDLSRQIWPWPLPTISAHVHSRLLSISFLFWLSGLTLLEYTLQTSQSLRRY